MREECFVATIKQIRLMAVLAVTCVLAGCVGVFVVPPNVAQATFPGQNGNIAYSAYDGNDYEIYTINPTGGTPFQVTDNNVDDRRPSYSPDGNKIAYASTRADGSQSWQIYTIDATGGTPFQVTNNDNEGDWLPSYSPDGNKISFASSGAIYTIDSSGGTPFQVTENNAEGWSAPSWSIAVAAPDTIKPSTSTIRSVEPNAAGWNKENVTVTLKATDNQNGSGVQKITYSASGAQNIAQTDVPGDSVEVAFDQQGTTTLTYYATDKAGNVEIRRLSRSISTRALPQAKSLSTMEPPAPVADR
jgi:dipeptidyl aminopeptidase/acylaminoacyl peptidase